MKLKLIEKRDEAESLPDGSQGTKSFFFEPEKEIKYIAGQYYYFTLPKLNYPDPRGATRHFTLSSSPTEGKIIRLTTRVRQESGFKKTLDELSIGSVIEGEGPTGTFILNENLSAQAGDKSPQIFLAGGIGITPFRSMIKYNIDKELNIPMHLIYSNSTVEQITFRKELEEWASSHPEFLKIDMTISKPEESQEKWNGIVGRIDADLVTKLTSGLVNPTYWLCGPPPMVDALEIVLAQIKITGSRLRIEKFTGY